MAKESFIGLLGFFMDRARRVSPKLGNDEGRRIWESNGSRRTVSLVPTEDPSAWVTVPGDTGCLSTSVSAANVRLPLIRPAGHLLPAGAKEGLLAPGRRTSTFPLTFHFQTRSNR